MLVFEDTASDRDKILAFTWLSFLWKKKDIKQIDDQNISGDEHHDTLQTE